MQRSISTRSSKYHRIQSDNMLPNIPDLSQPIAQADINATKMSIKGNTTHLSQRYRQTKNLERSQSQPPLNSSFQIIGNSNFQGTSNQFYNSNFTTKPASARSNSEPTRSVASRSKSELNGWVKRPNSHLALVSVMSGIRIVLKDQIYQVCLWCWLSELMERHTRLISHYQTRYPCSAKGMKGFSCMELLLFNITHTQMTMPKRRWAEKILTYWPKGSLGIPMPMILTDSNMALFSPS